MDDDPEFLEPDRPQLHRGSGRWLMLAGVAALGIAAIYWGGSTVSVPQTDAAASSAAAGWDDLAPCSLANSFDRAKELDLYDDGRAVIFDLAPNAEAPSKNASEGTWRLVQPGRYELTIHGTVSDYTVVMIGVSDVCALIKGSLTAADLSNSWFSSANDADGGDSYEPDRPDIP